MHDGVDVHNEQDGQNTQKEITLKQVKSGSITSTSKDISDLEEGDEIGGYRVENIEYHECEHPKRRWRVSEQLSEEEPTVTSTCTTCGHREEKGLTDKDE